MLSGEGRHDRSLLKAKSPRIKLYGSAASYSAALRELLVIALGALLGVFVLFVQNLALATRRAACSKARRFGSFRVISD
jgi:hypothetical protein